MSHVKKILTLSEFYSINASIIKWYMQKSASIMINGAFSCTNRALYSEGVE